MNLYLIALLSLTNLAYCDVIDIFKELNIDKSIVESVAVVSSTNKNIGIINICEDQVTHKDLERWLFLSEGRLLVFVYKQPQLSYNKDNSITMIYGSTFRIINKDGKSYIVSNKLLDLEFASREIRSQFSGASEK